MSDTEGDRQTLLWEIALGLTEADPSLAPEDEEEIERMRQLFVAVGPGYELAPPRSVKAGIDAVLFPESEGQSPSWLNRLGFWQAATGILAAVTVVLAGALFAAATHTAPGDDDRLFVLVLSPTGDTLSPVPAVVRSVDGDVSISIPRLAQAAPVNEPTEFDRQLWLILEGQSPLSMGLLPDTDLAQIAIAPETAALLDEGVTLAVSLEPEGGSPTGLPTGPILAVGSVSVVQG